jgi:hypothetical protein
VTSSLHFLSSSALWQITVIHFRQLVIASRTEAGTLLTLNSVVLISHSRSHNHFKHHGCLFLDSGVTSECGHLGRTVNRSRLTPLLMKKSLSLAYSIGYAWL